jgi:hypothetical protein
VLTALLMLTLGVGATPSAEPARSSGTLVARPAPPEVIAELRLAVERARQRFEARDAEGVLAAVSEQYRSDGFTKAAVRQQLLAMFALHNELRARITIEQVQVVDGGVWLYTSGEVSGQLPILGWVTVLAWQGQPEVARREGPAWRLFGFQN